MKLKSRSTRIALAGALIAGGALATVQAPAAHATGGGFIAHVSPDEGSDTRFRVSCDGQARFIREGENSNEKCTSDDVNRLYVEDGHKIFCEYRHRNWWYDGPTFRDQNPNRGEWGGYWHSISDSANYRCYDQLA